LTPGLFGEFDRRIFFAREFLNSTPTLFFQYETRKQGDVVLDGANASAEEADEGTDEACESGIDIVLNHRLVETGFPDKKAFTEYLKVSDFIT
jgi:hypothetical protein